MEKRFFVLLLAFTVCARTMLAGVKIGDLYYNLNATNQTAEVTSMPSGRYSGDITIPDSVEYNSLIYNVTSIGEFAFGDWEDDYDLKSIIIPNSVVNIGGYAFKRCRGLTTVTIGNSVTSIGDVAFEVCSNLTSIIIPNSVISIGEWAFAHCSSLKDVTIGNSVTNLDKQGIFYDCTALTDVIIGSSVTSIMDDVFRDCNSLTNIVIENVNPPSLSDRSLGCYNLLNIYVPCGTLNSYQSSWSEYSHIIKYKPSPYIFEKFINISGAGQIIGEEISICTDSTTMEAIPNEGYHFVQWNDWNTGNPRTIELTQDTTFTAEFALNPIITYIFDSQMGTIQGPKTTATGVAAENITFEAISKYGYHFVKWNDSVTDNPRTIWLSQDTTFTAEFAKNKYTISTQSANQTWGTTAGDTTAQYLDEVEISAIPNHGYHFVRWNDYNTSNTRTVSVTGDKTYTATFAKNVYSITTNAEHGSISGNSSAEYLDFVTLTVTPNYGYHFVQWSDGLKDNPRIFQITSDTTFTAEFAYDRVGTCGKDLALVWSYDPTNKVLTIGNAGSFTENMQFGAEAPNEMEELVIGNSVTAIGANAFAGISSLKKVSIGESVKTIGEQAFYNCVNLETIFNYRPTPTNTYSNAFDGVDKFECALYVLSSSIDMYKNASVWRDFYYTYAIGAEETTVATNDVTVEPQNNAATVTWPTFENAASYTIQITKDGVLFCTLIFNANGQLIGIAFAPSRDGQAHAPAAIMTANGMQFTVTGLDSGTHYDLTLQAKDSQNAVLASYSSNFTTTGDAQGFEDVQGNNVQCTKVVRDGQIFILRGEKVYNAQGALVK